MTMSASSKPTSLSLLGRVLELEYGESRLLHYGLFDDPNIAALDTAVSLLDAQQRFAAELAELLEKAGTNAIVLLVGDSILPLAKSLAETGKTVHWFGAKSLLDAQIQALKNFQYGGDDFVASAVTHVVDVLVYAGSIRYLDQMALLSKSRDFLGESGQLVMCSEFLVDDSCIEYSTLPNLSSFHRMSKRLGFEQVEGRDLSTSAAHSLKLLQPLLEEHGATLVHEAVADSRRLDELQAELSLMQDEFFNGRRGFYLYILGRESSSKWAAAEFGDIQSFQPAEIADLFRSSFEVDFDEELWDWKYAQSGGKCVVVRLDKQGDIVAHYGGAPRKIVYFGELALAIQPCDVMVHPSIRTQYGKGSLFFEMAATFLEREIGNAVTHLLGFGFPNQKTMNISKRLGLYEKTDDFVEIFYPVSKLSDDLLQQQPMIEDYDPLDSRSREELDRLWSAMQSDYREGIIGVRDADYIQHRYVNHPFSKTQQYRCVMIREDSSKPALAFAVMKEHDGAHLLMDLVCPMAEMKSAISILIQELGRDECVKPLRLWLTASDKDNLVIDGAVVNTLGIEIPCNSWSPGPSVELLHEAWWLTAGDMDFI